MAGLTGNPLLTNEGDSALLGTTFDVVEVALGSASWTPTKSSTGLQSEVTRVPATGVVSTMPSGDTRLRITAVDGSALSYDLREFALLDASGNALIIHSQAAIIGSKGSGTAFTFSHDLLIDDPGAINITIAGDNLWLLPQASESLAGVIEIATDAEAAAGVDDVRAITARHLAIATPIASTVGRGLIEIATTAEVAAGTDPSRAMTPAAVPTIQALTMANALIPRAQLRVRTGTGANPPDVVWYRGALPDPIYLLDGAGQYLRITMAPDVASHQDNGLVQLTIADSPSLVIGAWTAEITAPSIVEVRLYDGFNGRVDLDTTVVDLGITVYGDAGE